MARTKIDGESIQDGAIERSHLNVGSAGVAVIAKAIAGTGIEVSGTGADAGTGDVTISAVRTLERSDSQVTVNNTAAVTNVYESGAFVVPTSGYKTRELVLLGSYTNTSATARTLRIHTYIRRTGGGTVDTTIVDVTSLTIPAGTGARGLFLRAWFELLGEGDGVGYSGIGWVEGTLMGRGADRFGRDAAVAGGIPELHAWGAPTDVSYDSISHTLKLRIDVQHEVANSGLTVVKDKVRLMEAA